MTIAHRKAIDVTRATARRAIPVAETPERRFAAAPRADERDLDLVAAVAALPPRQREAVAYRYLAGLTHAEVAALVGRRPAAVRRAAADGMATLRRTYPRLADEEGATP